MNNHELIYQMIYRWKIYASFYIYWLAKKTIDIWVIFLNHRKLKNKMRKNVVF